MFCNTIKSTSVIGDVLSEKFLVDIFKIILFSKKCNGITYEIISQSKNFNTIYVVILRAIAEIGFMVIVF